MCFISIYVNEYIYTTHTWDGISEVWRHRNYWIKGCMILWGDIPQILMDIRTDSCDVKPGLPSLHVLSLVYNIYYILIDPCNLCLVALHIFHLPLSGISEVYCRWRSVWTVREYLYICVTTKHTYQASAMILPKFIRSFSLEIAWCVCSTFSCTFVCVLEFVLVFHHSGSSTNYLEEYKSIICCMSKKSWPIL